MRRSPSSRSRRARSTNARRRPLLVAAIAVLLALPCALPAQAQEAAPPAAGQVTIAPVDAAPLAPLPLADLAADHDVRDRAYTLRAADGTTSEVTVAAGISLGTLLGKAGVALDSFDYVEIPRPDGTSVIVTAEQIAEPGDAGPPVVFTDADGVRFLRPSSGEDDPNAADLVTFPDGAVVLQLRVGAPFAVRIRASALRGDPGDRIDFSASLVSREVTPEITFEWYFDDSTPVVAGETVTHRFARGGRYKVLVNVLRHGETIDAYDVVLVRIATPPRDDDRGARESSRERRGGSQDTAGENDGGTGGSGGSGGGGSGFGGSGSGGGSGAPTGAYSPPVVAPVVTPDPSPPPAADPRPRPRRRTQPQPQEGEEVTGLLLASASGTPLPAGGDDPARAQDAGANGSLHVPTIAWVLLGLAAILAVGWTLEGRRTLPYWQP